MRKVSLWLVGIFLLGSVASAEIRYNVIDLGTLGGDFSSAYGINNHGQIVGRSENASGAGRATLFDATGGGSNIDLGTTGGIFNCANAINDAGQIVGGSMILDATGQGQNINLVPQPGNYQYYTALDINNSGSIVGECMKGQNEHHQVVFDATGQGSNWVSQGEGSIYAVNDNGECVGYRQIYATNMSTRRNYQTKQAFLAVPGQGTITLADCFIGEQPFNVTGVINSEAWSINNLGQIVGTLDGRPTLFDTTGNKNNLFLGKNPRGTDFGVPSCINNLGQIVGYYGVPIYSLFPYSAVLFDITGNGNNLDLNTLIDPTSGWTLNCAYAINDNGWIVGQGVNSQGQTHGYLLTPIPEPMSLSLLALGGVLMAKRRK